LTVASDRFIALFPLHVDILGSGDQCAQTSSRSENEPDHDQTLEDLYRPFFAEGFIQNEENDRGREDFEKLGEEIGFRQGIVPPGGTFPDQVMDQLQKMAPKQEIRSKTEEEREENHAPLYDPNGYPLREAELILNDLMESFDNDEMPR